MIIDALSFDGSKEFHADICIIGAGVAGIVLANELISSGNKIILLESGNEAFEQGLQDLYQSEDIPEYFPDTTQSRLRMLGGSSNHWENSTERFDPIDFKKRNWVENSGWPIEYSEVEKHYLKAEDYCGVHADGYNLADWEKKLSFKDLCENSDAIDSAIVKVALPPTRFFDKYGGNLNQSGSVKVIKNANLTDLDFNTESQRVTQVTFKSNIAIAHHVTASIFILCMGGIENARMLLIFNEKYSNKLGNRYDNVGRYFMEHPVIRAAQFYPYENTLPDLYAGVYYDQRLVKGRLKLKEKTQYKHQTNNLRLRLVRSSKRVLSDGISSMHILSDEIGEGRVPDGFGAHIVNVLADIDLIADSVIRKTTDNILNSSADDYGGYQVLAMIEQSPDYNNRITLGKARDRFNLKRTNIEWSVTESDKNMAWASLRLLATDSGLHQYGRVRLLRERESRIWGSQLGFSQHHMGATRMSHSEKEGVVDGQAKVYGTKNLYIGGSSVFPTGGHVPPTLTIVAMAIKMANDLKEVIQ